MVYSKNITPMAECLMFVPQTNTEQRPNIHRGCLIIFIFLIFSKDTASVTKAYLGSPKNQEAFLIFLFFFLFSSFFFVYSIFWEEFRFKKIIRNITNSVYSHSVANYETTWLYTEFFGFCFGRFLTEICAKKTKKPYEILLP